MAELHEYEEVGPVRRDEKHLYDDIKNGYNMVNVSSPSWKQYITMLIIVITVSLMCAIVNYFTVNAQLQQKLEFLVKKNETNLQDTKNINNLKDQLAQLQQKLESYDRKSADIERKNKETENRNNLTFSELQKQIKDSTEQVAITAHHSSSTILQGIIKFDDIRFRVGINNLPTYKSTGKFVVEKKGLYMISVAISSTTNGAQYYIYLNGITISNTMIGYTSSDPSSMEDTGTVVLARRLNPNDRLWVIFPRNYYIYGGIGSTLIIVKIK